MRKKNIKKAEVRSRAGLYAWALSLSAFLIFFIQPVSAKALLPMFGGGASVWAVSMAFFTTLLCVGYYAAYRISRYAIPKQIQIHRTFVMSSCVAVLVPILVSGSIVFPSLLPSTLDPSLSLTTLLLISVGVPYVTLALTGPLLQSWYVRTEGKEPFHLYRLSNIFSLCALISFPFLFEPSATHTAHSLFLLFGYLLFAIASSLVYPYVYHNATYADTETVVGARTSPSVYTVCTWIYYTALPTALLVATTTYLTQVIAPVPLLWIAPLAVYLLSFVCGFQKKYTALLTLLGLCASWYALSLLSTGGTSLSWAIVTLTTSLFFIATACHSRVFALRPEKQLSAYFYVCTTLGGAIGSLVVSFLAPLTLKHYYEIYILLTLAAFTLAFLFAKHHVTSKSRTEIHLLITVGFIVTTVLAWNSYSVVSAIEGTLSRNFYGVTRVTEDAFAKKLFHGSTLHGMQFTVPGREQLPTAYYGVSSGIERALTSIRAQVPGGISVGVVGLGVGTIASYCRPEDSFTFFEIDPRIVTLATEEFSFLRGCPNTQIYVGDGRALLSKHTESFDLLVIDAFSDDAVPMHLLTLEAVELYLTRIKENGILAINTSNRILDLTRVVRTIAETRGVSVGSISTVPIEQGFSASTWMLLSKDAHRLFEHGLAVTLMEHRPEYPLWQDSYTNIFPALYMKPWQPFTTFLSSLWSRHKL